MPEYMFVHVKEWQGQDPDLVKVVWRIGSVSASIHVALLPVNHTSY